jgi:hypothetical protein
LRFKYCGQSIERGDGSERPSFQPIIIGDHFAVETLGLTQVGGAGFIVEGCRLLPIVADRSTTLDIKEQRVCGIESGQIGNGIDASVSTGDILE